MGADERDPRGPEDLRRLAKDLCKAWLEAIPSEDLPIEGGGAQGELLQRCLDAGLIPRYENPHERLLRKFIAISLPVEGLSEQDVAKIIMEWIGSGARGMPRRLQFTPEEKAELVRLAT